MPMRRTRTDDYPDADHYDCVGGPLDGVSLPVARDRRGYSVEVVVMARLGPEWRSVRVGEYRMEGRGPRVVLAWYDNTLTP